MMILVSFILILPVQINHAETGSYHSSTTPIVLKDLNYKTFFMKFYQKDIRYLKMQDVNDVASVGLDDGQGNIRYAVYMPVQNYTNLNGEKRYIVWLQLFDQEDGRINTGHPSRPIVEMYLFKKLANGNYQLLSQNYPEMDVSGSWGESHLSSSDFKSIRQVGKNQMGLFYGGGYTSTGEVSEWQYLIVLNENGWIQQYPFGYSSSNIGAHDEKDPEYGAYRIDYRLKPESSATSLYPIEVSYQKQGKMDWRKLPKNGTKETLIFSVKKNCYLHANQQCDSLSDEN